MAATTALEAKKKGKGGGNNEGAQPRERKEKDDVIEVGPKRVAPHPPSKRNDWYTYSSIRPTIGHMATPTTQTKHRYNRSGLSLLTDEGVY